MGQESTFHSFLIHLADGYAGSKVKAVCIDRVVGDGEGVPGIFHPQHRLEHDPGTVLDKLADGMQVSGKVGRHREQALAVLALGFCHQLLVPLAEHGQGGLIAG